MSEMSAISFAIVAQIITGMRHKEAGGLTAQIKREGQHPWLQCFVGHQVWQPFCSCGSIQGGGSSGLQNVENTATAEVKARCYEGAIGPSNPWVRHQGLPRW